MQESYKVLREAIDTVGVKKVAAEFNISPAMIYKWCENPAPAISYKDASGAVNPLDRIRKIYEITADPAIIQWVCQIADGCFVKNVLPQKNYTSTKVLTHMQRIIKEFSETLNKISEAYDNDKKIDHREAAAIRKEWEDLKCITEGFVRACEYGKFN